MYENTPSDKFARLEYMLRCKRDMILEEVSDDHPQKEEQLRKLDEAIARASLNFHKACAREQGYDL